MFHINFKQEGIPSIVVPKEPLPTAEVRTYQQYSCPPPPICKQEVAVSSPTTSVVSQSGSGVFSFAAHPSTATFAGMLPPQTQTFAAATSPAVVPASQSTSFLR